MTNLPDFMSLNPFLVYFQCCYVSNIHRIQSRDYFHELFIMSHVYLMKRFEMHTPNRRSNLQSVVVIVFENIHGRLNTAQV